MFNYRCLVSNVGCSFANLKHLHIFMIQRLIVINEECNVGVQYEYEIKKSKYETCGGNQKGFGTIQSNTKWSSRTKLIITLRSTLIYESEYSWIVSLTWTRRGTTTNGGFLGKSYCHILCITWKSHVRSRRRTVVNGAPAWSHQTATTKDK